MDNSEAPKSVELPNVSVSSRVILSAIFIVLALGIGAWGMTLIGQYVADLEAQVEEPKPVVPRAVVLELESVDRPLLVESHGFLKSPIDMRVSSEVAGVLVERRKSEGDSVSEDEVVAVIDDEILRAQLEGARAREVAWISRIEFLEKEHARFARLAESKTIGVAELERVSSELRSTNASLVETRALIKQTEIFLRKSQVRSRGAGVWFENHAEAGEYLQVGQPIGTVRAIDPLELEVEVGSSARAVLSVGDTAKVEFVDIDPTVESSIAREIDAKILRLPAGSDAFSRRFPVILSIANPEKTLTPGLFAAARFTLSRSRPLRLIPKECVFDRFGQTSVYVVVEEAGRIKVEPRFVQLQEIKDAPSSWHVEDGLDTGERVVLSPIEQLQPGAEITIGDDA